MMALVFPYEDQNQTTGFVRFTPCNLEGGFGGVSGEVVQLYLPPGITFSDGANYEGFEMGMTGIGMDAMNASNDEINGMTAGEVYSELEKLNNGSKIASSILSKMAGTLGIAPAAIGGGLRVAPNPNTRVLFKSVALRTFQFSFKMIPTSFQEAEQIKKIVLSFRSQMYPELAGGSDTTSIGYLYPDMYKIEMTLGGRTVPPNVKPSFLTSVATNFNASSGAVMAEQGSNEYWSEVDLSLTFGEGVTLNKKDIRDGF